MIKYGDSILIFLIQSEDPSDEFTSTESIFRGRMTSRTLSRLSLNNGVSSKERK